MEPGHKIGRCTYLLKLPWGGPAIWIGTAEDACSHDLLEDVNVRVLVRCKSGSHFSAVWNVSQISADFLDEVDTHRVRELDDLIPLMWNACIQVQRALHWRH
jgi:hypothetical protein